MAERHLRLCQHRLSPAVDEFGAVDSVTLQVEAVLVVLAQRSFPQNPERSGHGASASSSPQRVQPGGLDHPVSEVRHLQDAQACT